MFFVQNRAKETHENNKSEQRRKEETVVVKRVSEEKAGDFINFLKMLKNI